MRRTSESAGACRALNRLGCVSLTIRTGVLFVKRVVFGRLRTLTEVPAPSGGVDEEPRAGDRPVTEPAADRIDRARQAIGLWAVVEQGQLLRIAEVNCRDPDQPDAASRHGCPAQECDRGLIERRRLARLAWERRLAGESFESLIPQLELHAAGGQVVAAQAAGDRFGQVEQRGLNAPQIDEGGGEGQLVADALRGVLAPHPARG